MYVNTQEIKYSLEQRCSEHVLHQWFVVSGHYIDCTVPAQYTHLA